jgi:sugar phosphate permease
LPDGMPSQALREWRDSWTLVLTCMVGFSFLWVMTGSLSMFMAPISSEFGWSRTFVASGFTVASITTALLSPFFGLAIDRFGPRMVAIPGVIATAISIAAFSFTNGSAAQWLALWFFYAFVSISIKTTVWTAAVARAFNKSQGLALGVTLCGTVLAQSTLPLLANWLIDGVGWRSAYIWLGFGWGAAVLVLTVLFMRGSPGQNRASSKIAASDVDAASLPGMSIATALRDPGLWRIGISTLITMTLCIGFTIHQIPILQEVGISRGDAALIVSVAGATGVFGKIITGVLLDRFKPNWTAAVTALCLAGSFGLLIYGIHSIAFVVIAMLANGYIQGAKFQFVTSMTARYAGMKNYGAIFGTMNSAMACGAGAGPILAGLSFDIAGGYFLFLIFGVVGALFSACLMLTLPPYPEFELSLPRVRTY